ncbi:MAG TPA: LemA family protein [Kiloniellales bacterium]|nr:LemA family protein [Kiloniellales bacterium]
MASDERIRRMEADGILTPSQAAMLRESLAGLRGATGAPARTRRTVPVGLLAAGLAALLVGLFVAALALGPDQAPIQDVTRTLNEPGGYGEMNRSLSIALGLGVLLVLPLLIWVWMYNSLVSKEETVFEAWAQTESNFQRRADLVPALVETVSRYLRHESETLTGIARERGGVSDEIAEKIDALIRAEKDSSEILREDGQALLEDEERMRRLYEAQLALQRGMTNLFAVAESYPELRSADQFLQLQAQLEGTENRINVARMRFNDAVRDYNGRIRMLPWSLAAAMGGFQRKAYFRSEEEARQAPELAFD